MPDDATLNSNIPAIFNRITTAVRILRQILHFMTGFHSWVVVYDTFHHIPIGCGYNFLARCMPVVVFHDGKPKRLICYVLR